MGVTFDTGALIALERRQLRMLTVLRGCLNRRTRMTVPAPVLMEWWRGRTDHRELILEAVHLEPLTPELARIIGEALAASPKSTAIDAAVMASAAQRGDTVYTSDIDDLMRLQAVFPAVRVMST